MDPFYLFIGIVVSILICIITYRFYCGWYQNNHNKPQHNEFTTAPQAMKDRKLIEWYNTQYEKLKKREIAKIEAILIERKLLYKIK